MFQNLNPLAKPQGLFHVIRWFLTSKRGVWPSKKIPIKQDIPQERSEHLRITYIGHVTFLIQYQGINILTDPVFSERAGWMGPKRATDVGILLENLPKIDIILVSHNHYDHMDIGTLNTLYKKDFPKIIMPLKNDRYFKPCITLDWGQFYNFNSECRIHLEPAQHWSRRGIFDKNKSLWGTFIIEIQDKKICFIGDSGYDSELFKDIGNKHDIFMSLIPIGAYAPRWFMKSVHLNPEDAVLVHQDLKTHHSIASHFDVFPLGDEGFGEAPKILEKIKPYSFKIPKIGEVFSFLP